MNCLARSLALATSLVIAATASAQTLSPNQQQLFEATNQARAEQSLPPLQWDPTLAAAAATHAQLMAQNRQLSHQYPGEADLVARAAQAGAHFQAIAENVAMGPSAPNIQQQWMKSPPHRANILDPNLNSVGFAVVEQGGSLYAVADFGHSVAGLSNQQVEQAIGRLLIARGIQPNRPALDARQTCEMESGSAGGTRPLFIMRWQGSDLTRLPDTLEDRIATRKYQTAAVGSCSSANAESGFTTYRIAVLLY